MKTDAVSVVGLRKEDAIKVLEEMGVKVNLKITQPPRPRLKKEPISWRVIVQRETEDGVELVLTPEFIDWLASSASENK